MRFATPALALSLLVLAIGAIPVATTEWVAHLTAPEGEATRSSSIAPAPAGAASSLTTVTRSTPAVRAPSTSSAPAARAAAPDATASMPNETGPGRLPASLELVTLAPSPGNPARAPKPISRAEAVAAVMGSREFQDTISPLARLYLASFGRFPDYEGINYYTGQREEARPLEAIADEFAGSREFEDRYGALDNAEFVARIVANVLGHASQADVRAYWTAELDAGRMTRGQVIADLAESGAFRERSANQIFVSTAYIEILRRTPDPDGYARWVAHLNAGNSYRSVIDGLLASR